jgi:RNA polymerase sigma factor (sigma-70 family)
MLGARRGRVNQPRSSRSTRRREGATQLREFHRHELYQDVGRPLGVEDMIRLWLDPDGAGGARLEFDPARRDFSERDRAVLDLLRPHLEQSRRRAVQRRLAGSTSGAVGRLTRREREILELVADGRTNAEVAKVLCISPGTVRKHLENAYEKLDAHTRTGAVAALFPLELTAGHGDQVLGQRS